MVRMRGFLVILSLSVGAMDTAAAPQICNVALQACPKTLEGATIDVPLDAIWLDPKLPLCTEQVQVQTGNASPPPSIVFIIDNSGSMDESGKDPDEQRFKVTIALLDSIHKAQPATKVGIVVFNRRLIFDHRENPFFKQAFPGNAVEHDSYIPLTALNANIGGRSGLDTLKALLAFENDGHLVHETRLPAVRGNANQGLNNNRFDVRNGTDITLGFDAAKQALVGDNTPKEHQYFIFLSDGEPSTVDSIRQAREMEWMQGIGVPTTFTVFFTQSSQAPANLRTMNANIQNNAYSTSNPRSFLTAVNLQASRLLPILTGALNPIFQNRPAQASNAAMTVGDTSLTTALIEGANFVFPSRVPLAPNQTQVVLTYNYTYTDSGKQKVHTADYTVNIRRVANATPPAGVATVCKEQGTIDLLHNGAKINLVTADHEKLDVRLNLPSGETCANCKVTVQPNTNRAGKDNEGVSVTPSGGATFTGPFGRETSTNPVANDGKLQHLPTDSIVVVWTNPINPLDVIRKAFPYNDVRTVLDVRNHNTWSRTDNSTPAADRRQWVLVAPSNVRITPTEGTSDCCRLLPTLDPKDSVKFVGIKVTASRSFQVDIKVYDNLGQFVNKLAFSVSQADFNNLTREGTTGNNRSLRVLWDNRTEGGALAGTGAYVFKTTVTLNRVPGIAEDQVVRTSHRRVGVVRD